MTSSKTIGELITEHTKIIKKTLGEDYIKVGTLDEFAKRFIQQFCDIDVKTINLSEIFAEYKNQIDINDSLRKFIKCHNTFSKTKKTLPENEVDFYTYICEEYLNLYRLPKDMVAEIYLETIDDISWIEKNISELDNKIEKMKLEQKLSVEQRYDLKRIEFYSENNKEAERKIYKFLSHGICQEALKLAGKSNKPTHNFRDVIKIYLDERSLRWEDRYKVNFVERNLLDIDKYSRVRHAFSLFTVSEYPEICRLYDENRKNFYTVALQLILDRGWIKEIITLIAENHILNERIIILDKLLKSFEDEDYLLFCYIVPLQIEGLFNDICLILNIGEKQLEISSLNKKLEFIKNAECENNFSFYYGYYAFELPIIRNKIAHGGVIAEDFKELSIMLFFDFFAVCNLLVSIFKEHPIKKSLKLIEKFDDKNPDLVILKAWINYIDIDIPSFYQKQSMVVAMKLAYDNEKFFNYIYEEYIMNESHEESIKKLIKKLKGNKIAIDKCDKFFKNLGNVKKEREDRKEEKAR